MVFETTLPSVGFSSGGNWSGGGGRGRSSSSLESWEISVSGGGTTSVSGGGMTSGSTGEAGVSGAGVSGSGGGISGGPVSGDWDSASVSSCLWFP